MQLLEFKKKNISEILEKLRQNRSFMQSVTEWRVLPPTTARTADYPEDIASPLEATLSKMGIAQLYSHQREAYEQARAGENVVIVTPTASGKTLCYNLAGQSTSG